MGNYEKDFIEKMREEVEIPGLVDDKLNEIYGKIRQDEVQMKQTGLAGGRNRFYRNFVVAAAAVCAVVALSATLYANPALARDIPILGDVFGRLQERRDSSAYPDKDKTAYENIGEHSTPIQEAGNTAENEIGTMTVSDAYCDGYDMYFTLSLRVEDEELKTADYFLPMHQEGDDTSLLDGGYFTIDQKQVWPVAGATLWKSEDGVYVGLCRIPSSQMEGSAFADQMTVNVNINGLSAHKESKLGYREMFKQVEDDWSMQFDLKPDTSSNRTAEPNAESNGIIIQKVVQTPSNMHVTCYLPAELAQKNPAFVLLDGNGNRVQNESSMHNAQEDGSEIQEMVFNASQAEQFVMQVFDKNAGTDENGEIPMIAEIPFAM